MMLRVISFDYHCYFNTINMFLNLKSKRVQNALQNHLKTQNHPKTQRQERQQRLSKQHGQVRIKKPTVNAIIKKQTASTALTTIQPGSSCSNVAHYIIHRIESLQKEGHQSFNKSIEKMDSQRSQKIANAYRKIKKYDGSERIQTEESGQQKIRKSQNCSYYPNKKEAVSNFTNNYIAITQADEFNKRNEKNEAMEEVQYCYKMIQLFLQVFRKQSKMKSSSIVKFRSLSSKEIDLNDSLEKSKRSNKNLKNKGKVVTNRQEDNNNLSDFVNKIRESLAKCQQNFQALNEKYQQTSSLTTLMKEFYVQICWFVKQMQDKCMGELQQKCIQYEKGLQIVILQQNQMQNNCKKLEYALAIERNRNAILSQSLQQMHNRSLYSCAFFNQASYHFDLDTFIREKIYEHEGQPDSLINSLQQSNSSYALKKEFLESDFAFIKEKKRGQV